MFAQKPNPKIRMKDLEFPPEIIVSQQIMPSKKVTRRNKTTTKTENRKR